MSNSLYTSFLDQLETQNNRGNDGWSNGATKEPTWMISIPSITNSTVDGFKKHAYIHAYRFKLSRGIEANASRTIRPDGGVVGEDLKVVMPLSAVDASLDNIFAENREIPKIEICRLSLIKKKKEIVESYIFQNCFITAMLPVDNVLSIAFRYGSYERKSVYYNQQGVKKGQKSSQHDLTKSTSKAK